MVEVLYKESGYKIEELLQLLSYLYSFSGTLVKVKHI